MNHFVIELLTARENGLNQRECAFHADINPSTLNNWLSIGKNSKRGKYHNFYDDWEKAQVNRKAVLLNSIFKESQKGDWKASKYLLECMDPDTYVVENKVTAKVEHEGDEVDLAYTIREALGILPNTEETEE